MSDREAPPAFEDGEEQQLVWGRAWGCRSEIGRLRVALVTASASQLLRDLLMGEGVELIEAAGEPDTPEIAPRDLCAAIPGGVILTRPHLGESRARLKDVARALAGSGCPIVRTIAGEGLLAGGDLVWLGQAEAALGLSGASNEVGARQLEEALALSAVTLTRVQLPGMAARLEDALAPIDHDLVLTDPRMLPWSFAAHLAAGSRRVLELLPAEASAIRGSLVLRPGRILMAEEPASIMRDRIDLLGSDVVSVPLAALKAGMGLRGAVAPLIRDPQ